MLALAADDVEQLSPLLAWAGTDGEIVSGGGTGGWEPCHHLHNLGTAPAWPLHTNILLIISVGVKVIFGRLVFEKNYLDFHSKAAKNLNQNQKFLVAVKYAPTVLATISTAFQNSVCSHSKDRLL